nr:hypothetical protein [Tanacetum cinerariifolium]
SPPSPVLSPAPPPSPIRSLGYRAAMIRMRNESASTSSPPLQLPSASRREDIPEVTLLPQKRLGIALGPRYEIGESSYAAAARPARGLRADYCFFATMDREIMRDPEREGQVTALQAHATALQGQHGLAGGPTQPELPEEAGGLKSWERCGGGGVEGKTGESGVKGMAGNLGVKFCAGEGGLKSWERCGGGGVEEKTGESGVKGMAGNL